MGSNLLSLGEKISPWGVLNDTVAFGYRRKSASFMNWVSSVVRRTEAEWDWALKPQFSACHPLRMVENLLKSWLYSCGPGLQHAVLFALMSNAV